MLFREQWNNTVLILAHLLIPVNAKARFADPSGVKASAPAVARHNAGWDEVIDVAQNGYLSADTVTWANPKCPNTDNINAKDPLRW